MNKDSLSFKSIFQRQTKLAAYIIICTTIVVLSASYALFFQVDSNSNNQVVEAGDLTFVYSNNNIINNSLCFEPMDLDEANLYANNCSYQLSIRNTGSLIADYNLFLVPKADNTADLSNLKIIIRQNGTPVSGYPKGIVSGSGDSTHVGTTDAFLTGSINPGDTILYSAQIYVDDTTSFASSENKKVSFDIRGALVASDTNPINTPRPARDTLARLQQLNPNITVTPSTPNNPDFSTSDGTGVFDANDNYGLSYYFRGDIDYNYVKFGTWQTDYYNGANQIGYSYNNYTSLASCEAAAGAGNCTKYASAGDDMYWRIVRINGDGSIRMIYDGVRACGTDCEEEDNNTKGIGISEFHSNNDDNAHVGYMYGNTDSSTYEATHENLNDSPIKASIDSWYEREIANTSYHNYISDTLFCNDRSIASTEATNYAKDNWGTEFTNLGYGWSENQTLYGGYGRDIEQNYMNLGNRLTFFCPQKNDRFTVNDTTIGNGALTYPAGLITHDEASIGGSFLENSATYLTMTPGETEWTGVFMFDVVGEGITYFANLVRPVINLNGDAINSGTGTVQNPFRIE